MPTAPPSGSAKCLRFGHWLTLCTLNMHVLTYFLTYLLEWCGGIKKTHIKQEFTTSTASPVKTKGSKNTEDLHHTE